MIIAVDFDGTLCKHAFPAIGEAIQHVIDYCNTLQRQGNTLILWTCREDIEEGDYLTQAVSWCFEKGLKFKYINENPDGVLGKCGKVRKIMADIYIDDRALNVTQIPKELKEIEKDCQSLLRMQFHS